MAKKQVKSTNLYFREVNSKKLELVDLFLSEYRNAVQFYVKYYFNRVFVNSKSHVDLNALKKRAFYPFKPEFPSKLSGRALKCAQTQAIGMINASTAKQYKRVWKLKDLQKKKEPFLNLQRVVSRTKIIKPSVPRELGAELNSILLNLSGSTTTFDVAAVFSSLFSREYKKTTNFSNKITILLNKNRHFNNLSSRGTQMNSFLVHKNRISVRFEIQLPGTKTSGDVLGIDQGISSCITASSSNGSSFASSTCVHGWDLTSILKKLSRKQRGSRAFKRAQEHRKNYINYVINQIDLSQVKEVRFEKIFQMRTSKKSSRFLTHFTYIQIESKLRDKCDQTGVLFVAQTNQYRSQRCSCCGFVHSNNRKGKTFTCKRCGFSEDANVNASKNHLVDLPDLDRWVVGVYNRTTGFFWNPGFNGAYSPVK